MAATTTRKSHAARAAEKGQQDAADRQDREAIQPDPPDSFGGPSSDTRDREGWDQDQPEAKPSEPYALVDAETVMVPYHQPVVRVCVPTPDGKGETVKRLECPHRYKHETEAAALRCGRALAASEHLRIGVAE
jgi:hypothetical protein